LNYSLQEKNQYAYKMEGFDQDWNMVGTHRRATYTNLDPGVYIFRVKASNNDGVWNERGTAIRVIITPPFWSTWWFRVLMGSLLGAAVFIIYRLRLKAIRTEKRKLEERVIELDKAVAQGKFEIASDVLHDIGNAMVGLGSCLTRIQRSQQKDIPETLGKLSRFFESQRPAMSTAIGEQKADALIKMLTGLEETYKKSNEATNHSIAEQFNIIAHIQGILDIQRQYILGSRSHERKPVDVAATVRDCVSMLSSSMTKKNIAVSTEIPARLPLIKGDRTRMMQVFLNLLRNSMEAMGDQLPQRRISISIRQQTGLLQVQMADTGEGIDDAIRGRLFEKGFTTRSPAAGLGLYNSLNIVESHEGTLHLTSEGTGKGAVATIQFKLDQA
jgi:signal transduction histidine kinase